MPVSLAVELGRVRLPKADMPWLLYDQVNARGGFIRALTIPEGGTTTMIVNSTVNSILQLILTEIEIPRSYNEKAVARHRSLGEWLCRPESTVVAFAPVVVPQGSFRYGTVVRPIVLTQKYDLDNVTTLQIAKTRPAPCIRGT